MAAAAKAGYPLHFDEKYQCLLIRYKLTLFQKKQEQQQQPLMDFENGVIVKIYKS